MKAIIFLWWTPICKDMYFNNPRDVTYLGSLLVSLGIVMFLWINTFNLLIFFKTQEPLWLRNYFAAYLLLTKKLNWIIKYCIILSAIRFCFYLPWSRLVLWLVKNTPFLLYSNFMCSRLLIMYSIESVLCKTLK